MFKLNIMGGDAELSKTDIFPRNVSVSVNLFVRAFFQDQNGVCIQEKETLN